MKPLLAYRPQASRPLGESLPVMPSDDVVSPWTPRPQTPPAQAPTLTPAMVEEARAQGRAAGYAETAALRERLAGAVAQLEVLCAERVALASAEIADAVVAVVETWSGHEDRAKLFRPVIQNWLAGADRVPATVHVHPGDVACMKAAIGDAALTVVADPSVKPTCLVIRGGAVELAMSWQARLAELREQIAVTLDEAIQEDA
ncbi:MAG TPA: hypothetical protein VK427_18445 [Kofleriaceae bacterium]|nr:hypothetical protein [Kofleriaceae bacterium]